MKIINQFGQEVGEAVNNWLPKKVPPRKHLQGNYCSLEPINFKKHAEILFKNLSDQNQGESWTYLPYGPFHTLKEFFEWIQITDSAHDTQLYAILNTDNIPIGIAGYLRINPEHGTIEVGHLHYSKLLQRTPAATEAMFLMMHRAFDDLKYRRYEWKCNSLNTQSINSATRLGFKFEGIFRQANVFKGYNRDTAWYSIIDSEWPTLKEKLQRWLHPENFDQDGHQILSLEKI